MKRKTGIALLLFLLAMGCSSQKQQAEVETIRAFEKVAADKIHNAVDNAGSGTYHPANVSYRITKTRSRAPEYMGSLSFDILAGPPPEVECANPETEGEDLQWALTSQPFPKGWRCQFDFLWVQGDWKLYYQRVDRWEESSESGFVLVNQSVGFEKAQIHSAEDQGAKRIGW
jgi:hypothetical protein